MKEEDPSNFALKIFIPLVYLFFWYAIPAFIFCKNDLDMTALTWSALPVIFIGVISRQTSWSIFGDKGIKGDNIGRKIRVTINGKGSFEFNGVNVDGKRIDSVIKSVKENQIPKKHNE